MNYSKTIKIVDDMQNEVDSLYNILILLFDYMSCKQIDVVDCNKNKKEISDKKYSILTDLVMFTDMYKNCKRVNTRNETITKDRIMMDRMIKEICLKINSELVKLESESNNIN